MATVSANPNPVASGEEYSLSGSGYDIWRAVEIRIGRVGETPVFSYAIGVRSTPDGIVLDNNYAYAPFGPDDYTVEVWQAERKEHGGKKHEGAAELKASLVLTVT